jgi:hypothetical protein
MPRSGYVIIAVAVAFSITAWLSKRLTAIEEAFRLGMHAGRAQENSHHLSPLR